MSDPPPAAEGSGSPPLPANAPDAIAAVLRENLAELSALLDAVRPADLAIRLGEDEWSVAEILLHLVHAERWMQPQVLDLRQAVAPALAVPAYEPLHLPEGDPPPEINELRWAVRAVREETLQLLRGLTATHLREPGLLGDDEEAVDISLRTMLLTIADHQLFHVRQIQRTLGRR